MTAKLNGLPEGMRFYLPEEARIMNRLRERGAGILEKWGYQPLYVPALLPYDMIVRGMSQERARNYYKLIDYQGDILVLRPEMTTAIAGLMARERDNMTLPARLYYYAPVYRHESTQSGKEREIYQLGAEFFGDSELADFEVLAVTREIIAGCGLEDYRLEIGHVGFLQSYLEELELDAETQKQIKVELAERNLVGFRKICDSLPAEKASRLLNLLKLSGGPEVLEDAAQLVSSGLEEDLVQLKNIYQALKNDGGNDRIFFDLTLVRNLDYYTGIVFEIMTPDLGYNICGGGRYDRLLGSYGSESIPAVGFAIGIERLRLAWLNSRQDTDSLKNKPVIITLENEAARPRALELINRLHRAGRPTLLKAAEEINYQEKLQQQNNYSWLIKLSAEGDSREYQVCDHRGKLRAATNNWDEVMEIVSK